MLGALANSSYYIDRISCMLHDKSCIYKICSCTHTHMYPFPTIFALCMLRLCSILRSADSFPFDSILTKEVLSKGSWKRWLNFWHNPGQGANAIGVEKEQIDDARGGRGFFLSQTSMCPGERVVATWVQVSSGFAGLVESDSDVKLWDIYSWSILG